MNLRKYPPAASGVSANIVPRSAGPCPGREADSLNGLRYGLTSTVKIFFWLILIGVIIQQVYGPSRVSAKRAQVLKQFEQERKSRVIALIHRRFSGSSARE